MDFKSLLLSKDAELVQTLTRLLQDLDIAVEPCSEPFAAAKRLMDQHFDAILVDCEEEQGAGWVLQSARMATASKKSVTIAIVGPQSASRGGPRAGENFTIQKPIVLKQVESTLRAARGLMGDSAIAPSAAPPATSPSVASAPSLASTPPIPKPISSGPSFPPGAPTAQGRPPAELFEELTAALDRLGPKTPDTRSVAQPPASSGAAAAAAPAWEKPSLAPPEPAPLKEPPAEPLLRPAPPEPVLRKEPLPEPVLRSTPPAWPSLATPPSPAPKTEVATVLPLAATSAEMKPVARPSGEQVKSNQTLDDVRRRMGAASPPAWRTEVQERQEVSVPRFASFAEDGVAERKFPFKAIAIIMVLVSLALFGYSWYRGRKATGIPAEQSPAPLVAQEQQPVPGTPSSAAPAGAAPTTSQAGDSSVEPAHPDAQAEPAPTVPAPSPDRTVRPATTASEAIAPDTTRDLDLPPAPLVVGGGNRPSGASPREDEAQLAPPSLGAVANEAKPGLGGVVNTAPVAVPKLAAAAPQRVRVSQGVTQGLLIHQVQPQYPPMARETRVEGDVVLEAVIATDGTVRDLKVISGPGMLASSALLAVRQWRYKPYLLNGQPVEVVTQIRLKFHL